MWLISMKSWYLITVCATLIACFLEGQAVPAQGLSLEAKTHQTQAAA